MQGREKGAGKRIRVQQWGPGRGAADLSSTGRISTDCVMSLLTTLRPPTWISIGVFNTALASVSTCIAQARLHIASCTRNRSAIATPGLDACI